MISRINLIQIAALLALSVYIWKLFFWPSPKVDDNTNFLLVQLICYTACIFFLIALIAWLQFLDWKRAKYLKYEIEELVKGQIEANPSIKDLAIKLSEHKRAMVIQDNKLLQFTENFRTKITLEFKDGKKIKEVKDEAPDEIRKVLVEMIDLLKCANNDEKDPA